jgi:hypothetical protein
MGLTTPLYLFLGVFVLMNFKTKVMVDIILRHCCLDGYDRHIPVEHNFERLACNDPDFVTTCGFDKQCAGGYSFTLICPIILAWLHFFISASASFKKWAGIGFQGRRHRWRRCA